MKQVDEYECVRKANYIGFAELNLRRCNEESKPNDAIDIRFYTKLVELDARLGTTASEQLFKCLQKTTRSDIIKVERFVRMKDS